MFVLSIVKVIFFVYIFSTISHTRPTQDKIPIHPSQFGLPPEQALINGLNKKYANRVLHDVGLCICVFDIAEAGEGKVRYGNGFLWYTGQIACKATHYLRPDAFIIVVFGLTVIRPFPAEIIPAKVKSTGENGIQCAGPPEIIPDGIDTQFTPALVSVGIFEDMWIPLVYPPQPYALYASPSLSLAPIPAYFWLHGRRSQ